MKGFKMFLSLEILSSGSTELLTEFMCVYVYALVSMIKSHYSTVNSLKYTNVESNTG